MLYHLNTSDSCYESKHTRNMNLLEDNYLHRNSNMSNSMNTMDMNIAHSYLMLKGSSPSGKSDKMSWNCTRRKDKDKSSRHCSADSSRQNRQDKLTFLSISDNPKSHSHNFSKHYHSKRETKYTKYTRSKCTPNTSYAKKSKQNNYPDYYSDNVQHNKLNKKSNWHMIDIHHHRSHIPIH